LQCSLRSAKATGCGTKRTGERRQQRASTEPHREWRDPTRVQGLCLVTTTRHSAVNGLLAALVGIALLLAAIVVAAVPAAAGNRVGASTPVVIKTVGVSTDIGAGQRLGKTVPQPGIVVATGVAAETAGGGERLLWTSWQNYPKVTQGGREYAQIGGRLYTQHAVDRMQPSGLGAPAGATSAGRSISPNFVEDVLGSSEGVPVKGPNGEPRLSYTNGSVQVITEDGIVLTVITR